MKYSSQQVSQAWKSYLASRHSQKRQTGGSIKPNPLDSMPKYMLPDFMDYVDSKRGFEGSTNQLGFDKDRLSLLGFKGVDQYNNMVNTDYPDNYGEVKKPDLLRGLLHPSERKAYNQYNQYEKSQGLADGGKVKHKLKKKKKEEGEAVPVMDAQVERSASIGGQHRQEGGIVNGKSGIDTNHAAIPPGSFVIPEKKIDQALKDGLLPNKDINKFQPGGVPVKLTKDEGVIPPEKAASLFAQGVDLNKYAPDSKHPYQPDPSLLRARYVSDSTSNKHIMNQVMNDPSVDDKLKEDMYTDMYQSRAKGGKIHIKKSKRGSLHTALGVKQGEKIPADKLAIKSTDSPAIRKKKQFALNAKKWHHNDGGAVKMQEGGILDSFAKMYGYKGDNTNHENSKQVSSQKTQPVSQPIVTQQITQPRLKTKTNTATNTNNTQADEDFKKEKEMLSKSAKEKTPETKQKNDNSGDSFILKHLVESVIPGGVGTLIEGSAIYDLIKDSGITGKVKEGVKKLAKGLVENFQTGGGVPPIGNQPYPEGMDPSYITALMNTGQLDSLLKPSPDTNSSLINLIPGGDKIVPSGLMNPPIPSAAAPLVNPAVNTSVPPVPTLPGQTPQNLLNDVKQQEKNYYQSMGLLNLGMLAGNLGSNYEATPKPGAYRPDIYERNINAEATEANRQLDKEAETARYNERNAGNVGDPSVTANLMDKRMTLGARLDQEKQNETANVFGQRNQASLMNLNTQNQYNTMEANRLADFRKEKGDVAGQYIDKLQNLYKTSIEDKYRIAGTENQWNIAKQQIDSGNTTAANSALASFGFLPSGNDTTDKSWKDELGTIMSYQNGALESKYLEFAKSKNGVVTKNDLDQFKKDNGVI